MNNKGIIVAIIIFLVIGGGIYFMTSKNVEVPISNEPKTSDTTSTPPPATTTKTPQPSTPPATKPVTYKISISGFAFVQPSLSVKKGDTVVWTNKDSAPHTITGTGWGSGTINQGQTYSFTFNSTGTFAYHCNFHPSMTGVVVVSK